MSKEHLGFKAVGSQISKKEGVPLDEAYAMLASSTRHSSKMAKMRNDHLNRVKGK